MVFPRTHLEGHPDVLAFRAPHPKEAQRVVIKKLNKAVVQDYLARGGHEDPYKEISRMQELGDGVHVLQCLEALQDDQHLYIVLPYSHERSLLENMPWGVGFPPHQALALFKNILEILLYLESHGIFHHDLAPDNFLFFNGRLVLFDFAMSLRVPRDASGQRYLMKVPRGRYGTFPCQAPEMFFDQHPYDGLAGDLWGAAVILYTLLTGHPLYRMPHPTDLLFRYHILAEGLLPTLNEEVVEILQDVVSPEDGREDCQNLMTQAMANPREVDMELVEAYLARRALDYLVGFNLSPVLWRKLPGAKSAGRVQSVCLMQRFLLSSDLDVP